MTRPTMSLDEFMTGLICAHVVLGHRTIDLTENRFDDACTEAFRKLDAEGTFDLRFYVTTHRVYGDSGTVREAVARAVSRGLITIDFPGPPIARMTWGVEEAEITLDNLPGGRETYLTLASAILAT